MNNGSPDRLAVTMKEAGSRIGVCEKTIANLVKAGRLPCVRIGRRAVRISVADLERFIASQRQGGQP